jgi:hypothetical protein
MAKSAIDRMIRQAAGRGPAVGAVEGVPVVDVEDRVLQQYARDLGVTLGESRAMFGSALAKPPPPPAGNAGAGTSASPPAAWDFNKLIREALWR